MPPLAARVAEYGLFWVPDGNDAAGMVSDETAVGLNTTSTQ